MTDNLLERVARAIDPKTWAHRDTDLTRRDEWEREIKLGWGETTFEQWADRSIGKSMDQARAAIDAMGEDLVGEMEKAFGAFRNHHIIAGCRPISPTGELSDLFNNVDELLSRMRDARNEETRS